MKSGVFLRISKRFRICLSALYIISAEIECWWGRGGHLYWPLAYLVLPVDALSVLCNVNSSFNQPAFVVARVFRFNLIYVSLICKVLIYLLTFLSLTHSGFGLFNAASPTERVRKGPY